MNPDDVASWQVNPDPRDSVVTRPASQIDVQAVMAHAVDLVWHAEYQHEVTLCHPREYAWASDPVGRAPSAMAIYVALIRDTIDWAHPEARRLLAGIETRLGAAPGSGQVDTPDCAPTSSEPEDDR